MNICQNCPLQEGGPHLYRIHQEDGWVRIREHQVFPGIWLAFKDAHTFAFPITLLIPAACWRSHTAVKGGWNMRITAAPFSWGKGIYRSMRAVAKGLSCDAR